MSVDIQNQKAYKSYPAYMTISNLEWISGCVCRQHFIFVLFCVTLDLSDVTEMRIVKKPYAV